MSTDVQQVSAATDSFSGIASGVLSVIGLGQFYDTYGELASTASATKDALQNNYNELNLEVLKSQKKFDTELLTSISRLSQLTDQNISYYGLISKNNYYENNIFIKLISIIIIIILFFMLIK